MEKKGIFDLSDINETLLEKIVFFDISYPGLGEPGCVIFITEGGDEYLMSQSGTDWQVGEIVKPFPDIYKAYRNREKGVKDKYGFRVIGNWKIIPEFAGLFFVRVDYFDKFYSIYQAESEINKEFPCGVARLLFGKKSYAPSERMVYIKIEEYEEQ